jgi:hypothetical protein
VKLLIKINIKGLVAHIMRLSRYIEKRKVRNDRRKIEKENKMRANALKKMRLRKIIEESKKRR